MRKLLLISILIGSLGFSQKKDRSEQTINALKGLYTGVNSSRETVPRRLSYQGLLTKANGRAVLDGTYQVTFKLYKESENGVSFWEETQDIEINDGVVSATLGVLNPILDVPANSYLEIHVNGAVLSPRQEMTSVFYSVVSDTAKYAQAGDYEDLDNLPDLEVFAKKDTLINFAQLDSLNPVALTGSYDDLDNVPDLSSFVQSDTLNQYTITANLSAVALSNDYNDLSNLPDLSQYATVTDLGAYVSSDTLSNYAILDSLGSMSDQNAENVNITGGSVTGISDLAIADGGTGASDNSTARSNLGLEIGVDVQGFDSDLADLADGSLSADKVEFLGNVTSDIQAQIDEINVGPVNSLEDLGVTADSTELNFVEGVTSSIQDQLDGKQDNSNNLTTLANLEHNHDHFIVSDGSQWRTKGGADAQLSLGLSSMAIQSADNVAISGGAIVGIEDLAIGDGGTGASDISTARVNLGVEIGVDVQGYDADLTDLSDGSLSATKVQYLENVSSDLQAQLNAKIDTNTVTISSLNQADGNFIVSDGSNWNVESGSDARTSLGLGSIATQSADNVAISGGAIVGIEDLAIGDGGTGASDVSSARSNLGLEIGIDVQGYDADLADLADGKLSSSKVEYGDFFIQSEGVNGQVWTSDGDGVGSWGNLSGITGAASTIDTEDLTASRALVSNASGKVDTSKVTLTELGYLDGVTSSVQSQLDGKIDNDDHLDDISNLAHADGNIIVSNGTKWTVESDADARSSLGIGTIATQAANNVSITGGSIAGINDLSIGDGGTGASDIATARLNLGLEIGVDVQAYDADLADLADGTLSASKLENNEYFITSAGTSGQIWTSDGDGAGSWAASAGLTGAASTIDAEDLTASRALVSNASGKVDTSKVTLTELGYLDGVTSSVQSQLDAKQAADADLSDLADGTLSASKVENNEYFITSAGTSGQVWTSDGDGAGSWVANSAATDIDGLTDAKSEGLNFTGSLIVGHETTGTLSNAQYNTGVGLATLDAITTGDYNTAIGFSALSANTTGVSNTAGGFNALYTNTTGTRNTATGYRSLYLNLSGEYNSAFGMTALRNNTSGNSNLAIGYGALNDNTVASYNTAVGANALQDANRTADTDGYNVGLGYNAGNTGTNDITTGNKNTLLGASTAASAAAGTNQTIIGYGTQGQANNSVTLGNADVTEIYMAQDSGATVYAAALGFGDVAMTLPTADGSSNQVLKTNGSGTLSWGSAATSINGLSDALVEDTGSMYVGNDPSSTTNAADYNVALGTTALSAVTTGDNNTAIGHNALTVNEEGNRNTAVGKNALKSNTSGITNVALGSSALERNTTANSNTAVGHASSYLLNSGQNNVSLGYESSKSATSANQNVILGADANPSAETGTSNQVVVGYGATGQANNSVTLGNADVTAVYMAQDQGATVYAAGVDITGSSGLILENDETITNSTDGTILIDGKADFNDNPLTGYGADLQTESGTSKTLAAADNGTIIVCSSNSSVTITVPTSLPAGFNCMIIQNGSGQVSLSASSTTLNNRNGSKTAGQYAILTLVHLGSNVFVVSGDTTS